jgi:hypothetical protein
MQLILSDKSWINIPDLAYILLKEFEKTLEVFCFEKKYFYLPKKKI